MPKTVVIIDDDADDLEIMRDALAHIDPTFLCMGFGYPDEAIHLLSTELILLPDFIFIDINIPRISGRECLLQLRSMTEFDKVPIIMYSTSMPPSVAETLTRDGASFAFQKPFGFHDYIEILQRIVVRPSID